MPIARHCILLALLLAATSSPLAAQGPWSVFVGGGAAGFGGATEATGPVPDGDIAHYKPAPTTRLHLGFSRQFGRPGVLLDVSYAKAGLGGYLDGNSLSFNPALTLYDVRLLATWSLITLGNGSTFSAALGPMLQFWSGNAVNEAETRFGGAVAVTATAPLGRRVSLLASGSLAVAGSPFTQELLDEIGPFKPVSLWTRELVLGLRYSW
jgi:hypothetical protein